MNREIRTIRDLQDRPEYALCQREGDFTDLCESAGVDPQGFRFGFALLGDGDILELLAYPGLVPDLSKPLTRLYPFEPVQSGE